MRKHNHFHNNAQSITLILLQGAFIINVLQIHRMDLSQIKKLHKIDIIIKSHYKK